MQLEVNDPRGISVHLAPTRDNIVASQKSRFEDQDKTIDYIVAYNKFRLSLFVFTGLTEVLHI